MKADRWEIIHKGVTVGHLADPSERNRIPAVNFVRYRVAPLPGYETLLADASSWAYAASPTLHCTFQFRHCRSGEVVSDMAGAGTDKEIAREIAAGTIIMLRLDDAMESATRETHLERLCQQGRWLVQQLADGWGKVRFTIRLPDEPVQEGKAFSAWLEDVFLKDEEGSLRARKAILAMGESAVPFVLKFFRFGQRKLQVRTHAAERSESWEIPSCSEHKDGRYSNRFHALFQTLAPMTGALVRELATLLEPPKPSKDAARLMVSLGGAALNTLMVKSNHPDARTRATVLGSLEYLKPVATALPLVLRCTSDEHASVRLSSLETLYYWVSSRKLEFTPEVLGQVASLLDDPDNEVRLWALITLRSLASDFDVSPVLPKVRMLRENRDPNLFGHAMVCENEIELLWTNPTVYQRSLREPVLAPKKTFAPITLPSNRRTGRALALGPSRPAGLPA